MRFFVSMIVGLGVMLFIFIVGMYVGEMGGRTRGKLECYTNIDNVKEKINESTIKFKNTVNGLKTIVPRQ